MIKEIGIGILSIALVVTTIGTINSHGQIASMNANVIRNNRQISNQINVTKETTNHLTQSQVEKAMLAKGINLDDAKKNISNRVNNAFEVAYTNMQEKDFDKDRQAFIQQLGPSFGKSLADLTQADDEYIYGHGIKQLRFGFGTYNVATNMLPVVITVTYKGIDNKTDSNDYWTVQYNVKSNTFSKPQGMLIVPPANN